MINFAIGLVINRLVPYVSRFSDQRSQFRIIPASMVGIYRTDQCTGTGTPFVSYWKKYRPYRPRTGSTSEIWLFRPIKMFRIGTNKKKKEKEKEEKDEKKCERERKR